MKEIFNTKIFADGLIPEVHASTILKVNENKFLCAFFGGTEEGKDDVKIYLASFDGKSWSIPQVIATGDNVPCWNPVLFEHDGKISLYYKVGKPITDWHTMVKDSFDGGETWSEDRELVLGDIGGRGPVKNKAIILKNGNICAPASIETEAEFDAFTDVSRDGGNTWEKSELVPFDHKIADGKGIIQPTLWEVEDKIYMLIRSSESRVMKSFSTDGGKTWAKAEKTDLLHNNSGIDCVQLKNGDVFVVHNPIEASWGDRNIISYAITHDNAQSFDPGVIIEKDEDTEAEFSYPAVITDDKYIYMTYTHNRKNIMFRIFEI
ncbi:MAG: exo-alpha-sialidase [Clostridia bacterium]|nr:exo-alpha-sialidase [Clostridia bacterium]